MFSSADAGILIVDVQGTIDQIREATFIGNDDDLRWDSEYVVSSDWYPDQNFKQGERLRARFRLDTDVARGVLSDDKLQTTYLDGLTRVSVVAGSYRLDLTEATQPAASGSYSIRQTEGGATGLLLRGGFRDTQGVFNIPSAFFYDPTGAFLEGFELPEADNEIFNAISSLTLSFVFEDRNQLWLQGGDLMVRVSEPDAAAVPIPAVGWLFGTVAFSVTYRTKHIRRSNRTG